MMKAQMLAPLQYSVAAACYGKRQVNAASMNFAVGQAALQSQDR
jgi:hypothetical protein